METILVLCTGNICRSPMAEALLRRMLPRMRVSSAGIRALVGQAADPNAVALMREQGYDISAHQATQLDIQSIDAADLVLVMERTQLQMVQMTYPHSRGKVFCLADSAGLDVPDPYRRGPAAFRTAFSIIEAGAAQWTDRVVRLASRHAGTPPPSTGTP
jgi:protein-tyrosine phosphatase